MIIQTILEGLGLGVLLIIVCAVGIRKGAVGMVHLYSPEVQERCVTLGLTTHAKIKRNALIFKPTPAAIIPCLRDTITCNIRFAIQRGSPKCWHTSPSVTVCRNCHLSESE